jgi:CheY-like chemotaxis protein
VPRILVADDNTNIQKMVTLAFQDRGIDVTCVGNGEAAVRRMPDLNPDLVLADVFMPVRNGYEVCEFVKKDERFSHVPVILLVGAFDPLDEKEARRVGADGVLKKPFVPPDPLIAMVMSALEKNPKVAAELAKAKEVIVEKPDPVMEIPAKAEAKPLPSFPEPTPEEAAAIYSFGSGRRGLDDEEEVEKKKEPKAPVGKADKEEDDDFDAAATVSDWRRSAMDFDIPEDAAKKPAFSSDEDFEPITFPSESDVPPRHVPVHKGEEEREKVTQDAALSSARAEATNRAPFAETAPEPAQSQAAAEPEFVKAPARPWEASREFSPPPRSAGWMDMMAPLPSEHPSDNKTSESTAEDAESSAAILAAHTATNVESRAAESSAVSVEEVEAPAAAPSSETETEEARPFGEQRRKRSWFEDAVQAVREAVHEATHSSDRSDEVSAEAPPEPVLSSGADSGHELISSPLDSRSSHAVSSHKDPALEEPVSAHVTPEPMLMKEEPATAHSDYAIRQELAPAVHSFLPPAIEEPAPEPEPVSSHAEPAPHEFAPDAFSERIPTAPPPNPEALSDIPFLNATTHLNNETVDAVVQRVLERLEPQLHDLLSKGVLKPLVENLLQDELAKREK